jgi:drug/metabolite transporter (DMT)-like permease
MDRPLRGILFFIAATMCFSTSDTMAKVLSEHLPAVEIAWIRYTVFVSLSAMLVRRSGLGITVRKPLWHVVRGLGLVGSAIFFMLSLRSLPLAEAATIGFASPLLITILSVPLLGEVVGARRWAAVVIGMLGVLVVVRPGSAAFQPAALYGLASSLSWAVATILTRKMAGQHPAAMLLWSAVTGLIVLTGLMPLVFVTPTAREVGLALVLGVVASTGQYLMVFAYRHASASLLAPFSYAQLLWAVIGGWLVFQTLPDIWTLAGGAIIAATGFIAVRSERRPFDPENTGDQEKAGDMEKKQVV